jgi:hypothetical protein
MRQFIAGLCANPERKSLIAIEGKHQLMRHPIVEALFIFIAEKAAKLKNVLNFIALVCG